MRPGNDRRAQNGCDVCKCAPHYLTHPPTPNPNIVSAHVVQSDIFTRDTTVRNARESIFKIARVLRVTSGDTDLEVFATPCRGEYTGTMHLAVRFKDEKATLQPGDMLLQGIRNSDERLMQKTNGHAEASWMVRPLTVGEMRQWRDCDWRTHTAPDQS